MRWLRTLIGRCPDCGEPMHEGVDEQWEAHRCSNCGIDHTGEPCPFGKITKPPSGPGLLCATVAV